MNPDKIAELESLVDSDGLLRPEKIVEFARTETTHLHGDFQWDDAEAAHKHRLMQARQLIRAYVKHEPRVQRECRAMLSVPTDRTLTGGYRRTSEVLDNPHWRGQVLEELLKKLSVLRQSYHFLPEAEPLFNAIDLSIAQYRTEIGGKQRTA